MDEASITRYVAETFSGVDILQPKADDDGPAIAAGDTFFIYDPGQELPPERTSPFATIVTKDYGNFDCASNLNRPGVFRLNIGVSKATREALFPGSADAENAVHDFTAFDRLLPHPVYGKMHWVCVVNPSEETFRKVIQPLLAEAYDIAIRRHSTALLADT